MAKSVDPDKMPCSAASDLGLHCLLKLYGYYGIDQRIIILMYLLVDNIQKLLKTLLKLKT